MSFGFIEWFIISYVICVAIVLLFRRFGLNPDERTTTTLVAGFVPVVNVLFAILIGLFMLNEWYQQSKAPQRTLEG